MRLHVLHETTYQYAPAVSNALHLAHLRPRNDGTQKVLAHTLQIDPPPAQCDTTEDTFGNARTLFSLPFTHEKLHVRAESWLETTTPDAPVSNAAWEAVRDRLRYQQGAPYEATAEFAYASPYVPRHEDFAAYARPSFAPGRPLVEAARELMSRIHADFTYAAHATDASTPALTALHLRRGVCQDFAHVMIGCLRSMGLAARYVSGYLLTEPPPGQPRLIGADASHAWASVWLQGETGSAGNWFDLDPTNNRAAGEDYVTLALGRDFADVSPLRGVIHGGEHHVPHVAVTVEPAEIL